MMSWECGECGQKEKSGLMVDAACHHCGKLLCEKHRIKIADEAFANDSGAISVNAFHCDACKKAHHPKAPVIP